MPAHSIQPMAMTVYRILLLCPLSLLAMAADWPQWRGPERTGVSTETGLMESWPAAGPDRRWIFRHCGIGYSGPAVVKDRLYILGARDNKELLLAIDANRGTELWGTPIGDQYENDWGDGPRGTPVVDGDFVYALGARGGLICAQKSDGKIVWQTTMEQFGGEIPDWGYTESVLIAGDHLVCTPGGADGTVLALDKRTGKRVWQSNGITDGAQYASLLPIEHEGRQYVQLTQQHVFGVSAENGNVLWSEPFPGQTAVVPTPIFHRGHVYVTAGYGAGCKLLKLQPGHQVSEVYANKHMKNHHGGVVLVGDHLYGYSDNVGWVCQDFVSGEIVWSEKGKLEKGSITCVGGRLICLGESDGSVVQIEASPAGWSEHGRFQLSPLSEQRKPRGGIWTHPVVANGKLYLRDQELLHCFNVR